MAKTKAPISLAQQEKILRDLENSDTTTKDFCASRGISTRSIYNWRRRKKEREEGKQVPNHLKAMFDKPEPAPEPKPKPKPKPKPEYKPLVIHDPYPVKTPEPEPEQQLTAIIGSASAIADMLKKMGGK